MVESQRDSDGEVLNSSHSSMSSESCSSLRLSFSRLSFEHSPENLTLKPHRSSDSAYEAIRSAAFSRKSGLSFRDFKLVRRIGSGDIGTVYLCRLRSSSDDDGCFYAMKVVDKETLAMKKKIQRAEMEKRILKMLDHPFLPTLYAEFEASHFSGIVMEYCSGGDLHSLKHKQPQKRFSLSSARYIHGYSHIFPFSSFIFYTDINPQILYKIQSKEKAAKRRRFYINIYLNYYYFACMLAVWCFLFFLLL